MPAGDNDGGDKEVPFNHGITSPEEAYWFGFLVGDGCIYEDRYRLKVALQKSDRDHLLKLAEFLGYDSMRVHIYGNLAEFKVDNKKLLISLYKLGLCQNKVHKTHKGLIPEKFSRDFIRGLFDADGTIHLRTNKNYLTADFHIYGTYNLLEGVKNNLIKNVNDGTSFGYLSKGSPSLMGFRGRWVVERIGQYLYPEFGPYLERKFQIFQSLFSYNKKNKRRYNQLDLKQIRKIKQLYKSGLKQKEIAEGYSLSQSFISRIINNRRYLNLLRGGQDAKS